MGYRQRDAPSCGRTVRGEVQDEPETALIDELLSFSRLQRQTLRTETLDLRGVVDEALETLASEQTGRHVELVFGDLPLCSCDPTLLTHQENGLEFREALRRNESQFASRVLDSASRQSF